MSTLPLSHTVADWLSTLNACTPPATVYSHHPPNSPCVVAKRKHEVDRQSGGESENAGSAKKRVRRRLTRQALAEMAPHTPQRQKRDAGQAGMTPSSGKGRQSKKSEKSDQSKPTANSSSSASGIKPVENVDNVRASLAQEGLWFEDKQAFKSQPDFKRYVAETVMAERESEMREESAQAIEDYLDENATMNEPTFFPELVDLVIKETRGVPKKVWSPAGEIISQKKTFWKADGLGKKQDCQFVKRVLPRRMETVEKKLGLTDPKPDWVYGLRRPRHPNVKKARLSQETDAIIEVASGLRHSWFAVENKGCEGSMEMAENQAIRSGASLVAAQRMLADQAGWLGKEQEPEPDGPDRDSIAFSCTWVPQMANINVHWHEKRTDGTEIYHMNKIKSYVMSDHGDLSVFRAHIHNILEYGLIAERKQRNQRLEDAIREQEAFSNLGTSIDLAANQSTNDQGHEEGLSVTARNLQGSKAGSGKAKSVSFGGGKSSTSKKKATGSDEGIGHSSVNQNKAGKNKGKGIMRSGGNDTAEVVDTQDGDEDDGVMVEYVSDSDDEDQDELAAAWLPVQRDLARHP